MKVLLVLEYDGGAYSGWQRQSAKPGDGPFVQSELESALIIFWNSLAKRANLPPPECPVISASGRTDAGVHARGQAVSFSWPAGLEFNREKLLCALNGITSKSLQVYEVEPVRDTFDARYSPHLKCYSYSMTLAHFRSPLDDATHWRIPDSVDLAAMISAAGDFLGEHDFKAFQAADCSAKTSVRSIFCSELVRTGPKSLQYLVWGKGFLKHMVRTMVGTLVQAGLGRLAQPIPDILASRNRALAGPTAPAKGLCLEWVKYA